MGPMPGVTLEPITARPMREENAGGTGALLPRRNLRLVEMFSGACLIGGGIWLALTRRS